MKIEKIIPTVMNKHGERNQYFCPVCRKPSFKAKSTEGRFIEFICIKCGLKRSSNNKTKEST